MIRRAYDALLLDLDGTLVDDTGHVGPRTRSAVRALHRAGGRVMIATGRSELGTAAVVEQLGIYEPAVVYNGAGLWCPESDRLLEERLLSNRVVERALRFGRAAGHAVVVMRAGAKFASEPTTRAERNAIRHLEGLQLCSDRDLPTEYVIRITFFSDRHPSSAEFEAEVQAAIGQPLYLTHFPLNALPQHRDSPLQVVDVQPPCRGKGEALRILEERWGIPRERVVAVGDATNDLPMFEGVGLACAMRRSMPEALAAAQRVIGDNNEEAIADLVDELFGVR